MSKTKNTIKAPDKLPGNTGINRFVLQRGVRPPERSTRSKGPEIIKLIQQMKPGSDEFYTLTPGELQTWSRYAKSAGMKLRSSAIDCKDFTEFHDEKTGHARKVYKVRAWRTQ